MSSYIKDKTSANKDFAQFHDQLKFHLKGDLIIDVESDENKLAKLLDMDAGIDLLMKQGNQLIPMSIRSQWGLDRQTFTIRYKRYSEKTTEYEKRTAVLLEKKGGLYPFFTIHAYLEKRDEKTKLLSCCVVKTEDLYRYILIKMPNIKRQHCKEGNEFLYIPFQDLINAKINIVFFGDNQLKTNTFNQNVSIKGQNGFFQRTLDQPPLSIYF